MKTIAQLSDLRFGRENSRVVQALLVDLEALAPSLAVVCGDVSSGGGGGQLKAASAFLKSIPCKRLVVPGDRDIPVLNPFRRLFGPLNRYRRLISGNLAPLHQDDEMTVYGLNTARWWAWSRGRISFDQVNSIRTRVSPTPEGRYRIVVTHHPFIAPPDQPKGAIDYQGRWRHAVTVLDMALIDLALAGHLAPGRDSFARGFQGDASFVMAQAGPATARQPKGRSNAYNLVTIGDERITVQTRTFEGTRFAAKGEVCYWLDDGDWVKDA